MSASQSQRKNVFISYSHADAEWLARLKVHLKPLEREGVIDLWSDDKIQPGSNWEEEIRKALKEAKVAVLLVSADFLASDFIHTNELPPLLAAAEKEDAVILPVIVSRSSFEENKNLSKYQAVNPPNKPLLGMSRAEQEDVFYNLHKSILLILGRQEVNHIQKTSIEPVKKMRPKEQKGNITIPKINLRSRPMKNLTDDAVKIMIKDKGFYDSSYNKSGTDFPNKYELQKDGRVVYDHVCGLMWQQSGSDKEVPCRKAKAYLKELNKHKFSGYNDWRLPTLEEAMSLMEPRENKNGFHIDSIFDQTQEWILTSDIKPRAIIDYLILSFWICDAWVIDFYSGSCFNLPICVSHNGYVRAVR